MTASDDRIVVVGAGECGARAVASLRDAGWAGYIDLIGDEPHHPYERPPLSKAALVSVAIVRPPAVADEARFVALDVDFRPGVSGVAIRPDDLEIDLSDGNTIRYHRVILATGARARVLPVPGGELAKTLRSWRDLEVLRPALRPGVRVGVIGAGFIGLEIAAGAVAIGCKVTVVEMAHRVLARGVPATIAQRVEARHRAAGVELLLGTALERIERHAGGLRVVLGSNAAVECDVVVGGVGAVPNVELGEKAGLAVDNGVVVDERLQTSEERIFAAGDCCSFPHSLYDGRRVRLESWRNALDQGDAAARNALGANMPYTAVPWFWSDQYELGLQVAGLPELATRTASRRRLNHVLIEFGLDDGGRLVSAAGIGPGTAVAREIRVAEILIGRRAHPDADRLADAGVNLKSLL